MAKFTKDELSRMPARHEDWPDWLYKIFPCVFIYYKVSKPKSRKRLAGWEGQRLTNDQGKRKMKWKKVMVDYKRPSTRQQNNFSFATCCLLCPNSMGSVKRSLKHKGYGKLVAVVYPTDQEINRARECWRYVFYKYKTMSEFYNLRQIDDPALRDLCDRLDRGYPSKASGQLKLL